MKSLQDSVAELKGVGPKRVADLATLNIDTIEDLLTYYPSRYDDFTPTDLSTAKDKQKITLKGQIVSEPLFTRFGYRRNRLSFRIRVGQQVVMVTFFNQPYLKKQVEMDRQVTVMGKWDARRQQITANKLVTTASNKGNEYGAIYPVNKHIRQGTLRSLIRQAFEDYQNVIPTLLPQSLRDHYRLMDRRQMIKEMHFPEDAAMAKAARRTATYEEFFLFQLRLQAIRRVHQREDGTRILYHNDEVKQFIAGLPFELTDAQKRVVNEICRDLRLPYQMNRLLQGDVGSGKTVVAAIAIYATITAGYQAALMAPTEILASQHAEKLAKVFAGTHVHVGLLTGSLTTKQHRELLTAIKRGDINLIIGTHALIQNDVQYANLGLVITDEQHRFGVNQRQQLREKGEHPDVLAMTATPIPRTLAITTYGEMDVSVIDQLPAGRKPIQTKWIQGKNTNEALHFLRDQLSSGAQAYVVSPLIEESESLDVQNATDLYQQLAAYFEPNYQVGLLHGRMSGDEKDAVMDQFKNGQIQVLVSTTVVEVGVDNPNATVMIIYDADRFGLAQLHQLRGRVGRGQRQSYCLLIADPKTPEGKERMKTMVATTDGFQVAQKDLELRGSGDILGDKQSGVPDFKVGDPVGDLKILQIAREDAANLLAEPHWDAYDDNQPLVLYLKRHQLETHFD
ncbi:DNA helicase RecG [Limosilactobacillus frumenti DSM 13145]|uniref:ATP-dependent DNA helicase RecG n=1 Tax=Limosilactobacillus frumenti DSM 13145 TaxID=1423746 RepID=A0A0R1P3W8_9LACO|nr:ATP-dependent DNA helicase RecG [Limosilactobacillus frumenti]KRL27278.1 DNA helicase RecG [Limosilactobacillus frumenti DSM 13145]MBA2913389.1 ATP-dependent DNA helicase RecG [Limosilactobacillus frumenti]QFG72728.1 ATP-dependent DNA helicase RecG [Limosilactobacillus frumenti]